MITLCGCGRCGMVTKGPTYTYAPECPHASQLRRANISAGKRASNAKTAAYRAAHRKPRAEIQRDADRKRRRMRGCGRDKDLSYEAIDQTIAQYLAYARYLRNTGQAPALTIDGWRRIGNFADYAPGPGGLPTAEEMAGVEDADAPRRPKRHMRQGAVGRPRTTVNRTNICHCLRKKPLNAWCCTGCRLGKKQRKAKAA